MNSEVMAAGDVQKPAVIRRQNLRESIYRRALPGLVRRVRYLYARVRFPKAEFGRLVDVRRRLCLRLAPSGVVRFGDRCILDNDMTIECSGTLTIGDRTIFGHHCTIASRDSVTIGEDCLIAEMVSIRDHNHRFDRLDVPYREQGMVSKPVSIGRNVWIGAKVTILMGVTIGDNAVIGANAVVTKDVPPGAVAVGIPAKVIRVLGN